MSCCLLNRLLIYIEKLHRFFCQPHDLFIFYKYNISRVFQYCRYVRRNNASSICMTYDQRAVFTHRIQFFRMVAENNSQCIRSFHTVHYFRDGPERIPIIIVVQKMSDDLSICLRDKVVSLFFQFFLQFQIIFNNSVVNNNDTFICIKMWMRIDIGRSPMSGPARMPDSKGSGKFLSPMADLIQHLQASLSFQHVDFLSVIDRNPGRVISPVFQLFQTIQENRCCLQLSNISNYSTHNLSPLLSLCTNIRFFCTIKLYCIKFASACKDKEISY